MHLALFICNDFFQNPHTYTSIVLVPRTGNDTGDGISETGVERNGLIIGGNFTRRVDAALRYSCTVAYEALGQILFFMQIKLAQNCLNP